MPDCPEWKSYLITLSTCRRFTRTVHASDDSRTGPLGAEQAHLPAAGRSLRPHARPHLPEPQQAAADRPQPLRPRLQLLHRVPARASELCAMTRSLTGSNNKGEVSPEYEESIDCWQPTIQSAHQTLLVCSNGSIPSGFCVSQTRY